MFKFLFEETGSSTLRVCIFLLVLSVCFYINWNTVAGRAVEWVAVGGFLIIVFGAKIIQKNIEEKNNQPTQ